MAGQSVVISVLADTKQMSRGMSDAGKQVGGLSSTLKTVGVAAGAALAAVSLAVGGFVAASIQAAGEAEKVAAQTEAVLTSTGHAAQRTAKQIDKLTKELSQLSGVDDEVIQAGQNVLLTFTKIQGATFDKATAAALDMSVALGKDLNSAATLVGKALNDPIAGIGALSRVGVQLTKEQKELIASMVEVGDVAGAQGVILKELETQFGGSAAAFGNTFQGAIGKVKTAFGNLQETIGATFLPALTDAGSSIADFLNKLQESPAFATVTAGLSEMMSSLTGSGLDAIGDRILEAFDSAVTFFTAGGGKSLLSQLGDLFDLLSEAGDTLRSELGDALKATLDELAPLVPSLLEDLIPALSDLIPVLSDVVIALLPLLPPLAELLAAIIPPLATALSELTATLSGPDGQGFIQGVADFISYLSTPTGDWLAQVATWLESLGPLGAPIADLTRTIAGFFDGAKWGGDVIENMVNRVTSFVTNLPRNILNAVRDAGTWLLDTGRRIIDGLISGLQSAVGKVWSWIRDAGRNIGNTFAGILGIRSPSRVFAGYGKNIVQGLVDGLSDTARLSSAMSALSADVAGGFDAQLDAPTGYRAASAGGNSYTITLPVGMPSAEAGRAIVQAIEEYERFGGRR